MTLNSSRDRIQLLTDSVCISGCVSSWFTNANEMYFYFLFSKVYVSSDVFVSCKRLSKQGYSVFFFALQTTVI